MHIIVFEVQVHCEVTDFLFLSTLATVSSACSLFISLLHYVFVSYTILIVSWLLHCTFGMLPYFPLLPFLILILWLFVLGPFVG
ncbi:hypothetical protein METBIDRAFT_179467 [Metschnikowia bicuspidata var. bicuspidata NRRL YB-4993]|uniref:Uncharacterized protein n=1 Tax=Metschnikowia bicuspidata var. bicuspidata NRRL YB-4993 TaxID=869754 RepID=A0A1A0HAX3_9ASCO|nr:hypothetical protein METBIDRAFT_179467 [Metschnikowia bicuspidata var. bicuspidata NRRL YB-4993]OBA21274.1 hypothetical protein METBIDRAFT_179467 [Metschnikowia bicuspidata var. bicuspidata NRRL YB-4993]